ASPEISSSVCSLEEGKLTPHLYGLSQGRHTTWSLVWKSTQDRVQTRNKNLDSPFNTEEEIKTHKPYT
ncbi:hypothetical protein J6590_102453, partial [Homalodisca vitripennis]